MSLTELVARVRRINIPRVSGGEPKGTGRRFQGDVYSPRKRGCSKIFQQHDKKGEQMTTAEDIKKYVTAATRGSDPDSRPIYAIMLFEHPAKELVCQLPTA